MDAAPRTARPSESRAPAAPACITSEELAAVLAERIVSRGFHQLWDRDRSAVIARLPTIDLAVIAFPGASADGEAACLPAMANVILSADAPRGHIVALEDRTLTAQVRWRRWSHDRWNSVILWDAPWPAESAVTPTQGPLDVMVPNPASLFKVLVAVGVMLAMDDEALTLESPISVDHPEPFGRFTGTVAQALDRMITASDNPATTALIKELHRAGVLPDRLRTTLRDLGLATLQLEGTQPDGAWRPPEAKETTGAFHMTAWDTARLLWLLDDSLPPPAWTVGGKPVDRGFLSPASKRYLLALLEDQGWHEALSSTATCGIDGRVAGIPAHMPSRWRNNPAAGDHGVTVDGKALSRDVRPCESEAEVSFAHKTGITNNFGSDAGIVRADRPGGRRYIISLVSNLGMRYSDAALVARYRSPCDDAGLCYTQRLPSLGRAIDDWLRGRTQPKAE